jgi:hypothetical protein
MNNIRTIPVNQLVRTGDGQGIRVTPRDSVPVQDIINNAKENMSLMPKDCFITKSKIHDETASAGLSLEKMLSLGYLRKEWFNEGTGNRLFTVKHGLPILAKHGLAPHFCVVLDPRPIQGISTHGYLRETLYSKAPKSTKFLVASMTHPSVTKWLIKNGYEVFGWHSAANGLVPTKEHEGLKGATTFVQGGTCSATRTISLSHQLGFRKANLIGFDSSLDGPPPNPEVTDTIDGKQVKKYWTTSIGDSPQFWTTGELIAQIQDLQMFFGDEVADVELNIIGTDKDSSLAGALAESIVNKTKLVHSTQKVGPWLKS